MPRIRGAPRGPPSEGLFEVCGKSAAASPDKKKDSEQHCEAWFYAGMEKLLSGDKNTAANYFHKCLATQEKDFIEFQLAQSELKALGK